MNMQVQEQSRNSPHSNASSVHATVGKCRVCLNIGDKPIFGPTLIAKNIMQIAGIEILEYDNLPKFLCNNCHMLLQSALLFRRTAQKTDLILKLNKDFETNQFKVKEENESDCSEKLDNLANGEQFVKCEYLEVNEATEDSEIESDWKIAESLSNDDDTNMDQAEEEEYLVEYLDVDGTDEEFTEFEVDASPLQKFTDNKKCYTCNQIFSSPEDLLQHKKDKHNITTCEICNEIINKEFYKVHIKLHRAAYKQKVQKITKKVECEICHKMVNKTYYSYHKKLVHGDENERAKTINECPFCNKTFSARNIAEHIKRTHDKISKNQSINCKIPKKQCPICDKHVKEDKYKEHLTKHGNPSKVYVCDVCGSKCASSSALSTHRLTHGNELKYKCNFCPYRGLHLGLLKIHVRTHTKDYNYKCTKCPAKFITKSNLSIHMQRHTGVGKYKCDQCDKTFFLKRNKENHFKAIHCTERNHKCDMCEATFAHRDGMLSHQIKVHKRGKLADHIGRLPTYLKNELKKSGE